MYGIISGIGHISHYIHYFAYIDRSTHHRFAFIHALIKNIFYCLNQQLLPVVKFVFKIGYSTETLYDNSNKLFSFGKYLSIIWRCRSRNASNSISLSDMFGFQLMLHHYHYLWSDLTGNLLIVMASLVASSQFME